MLYHNKKFFKSNLQANFQKPQRKRNGADASPSGSETREYYSKLPRGILWEESMFRKMRRERQQLSREETLEILKSGKTAILALSGDGGYPYAVPVNYVFCEADAAQKNSCGSNENSLGKILFHGAKTGHKIDSLERRQKVSLCVVQKDDIIKEKLTTAYKSVIVFGTARILQDEQEIFRAAEILGMRYNEDAQFVREEIRRTFDALCCVEIQIEHATGKQGSTLVFSNEKN